MRKSVEIFAILISGMMVGSQLSCSMGCHLLPHGAAGDLDAALFVQDSSQGFANGFAWGRDKDIGQLTFTATQYGIGTTKIWTSEVKGAAFL